jgi:hypothetical protein
VVPRKCDVYRDQKGIKDGVAEVQYIRSQESRKRYMFKNETSNNKSSSFLDSHLLMYLKKLLSLTLNMFQIYVKTNENR